MRKMTFISVQPDSVYFRWQVEVFIHNAMLKGVNPNWIEILFACDQNISADALVLAKKYPFVRFFFYPKSRLENYGYFEILRLNVLEQHFKKFPNLEAEPIFLHDCDIIFMELPDFESLNQNDIWYVSNAISYIGAEYIKSKGDDFFAMLCGIAGVDEELIVQNQENSGGGQYLLKGLDYKFWVEVKEMALALYKFMLDSETQERKNLLGSDLESYNPIQKRNAYMWAILWCGLKKGREIKISKELDFSWSSSQNHDEWSKCKILHNGGITENGGGKFFYKNDFEFKEPWEEDFSLIDKSTNSFNYLQAVLFAKEERKKY